MCGAVRVRFAETKVDLFRFIAEHAHIGCGLVFGEAFELKKRGPQRVRLRAAAAVLSLNKVFSNRNLSQILQLQSSFDHFRSLNTADTSVLGDYWYM